MIVRLYGAVARPNFGTGPVPYQPLDMEISSGPKLLTNTFPKFVAKPSYVRTNPTAQVDCVLAIEGKPRVTFSSRNVKQAP